MTWRVEILEAARDELCALPKDMRARFTRIVQLLEEFGPANVHEPHVKSLQSGLWEMRMTGRDGIARAIYVSAREERLVVVHVFVKKTQKTPQSAIALAMRRAKGL